MSEQGGHDNKLGTNDGENSKGTSSTSESIRIKVRDELGMEVIFKVKLNTAMRKIKEKYCEKSTKPPSTVRFLFDGETVNDDTTPKELEMEPDDIIEVVTAQTGGYRPYHN
ncbi:small ubiquitin-related modifier-like [Asterias amurensis]|uniref:small ubiquitin-related modifier-like n=1 Tax=Asterias amurensis TaxID=7602 RepID=UPI003AB64B39